MYTTLITASELLQLQQSGQGLKVFDCSVDLSDRSIGQKLFETLHILGASHADLDRDLSVHDNGPAASGGRHPLPTRENFAAWLGRTGFDNRMQAVVYDRNNSSFCARLWWMLKWAGHEAVAVLDGGLAAWQAAGGPVASGPAPAPKPAQFTLQPP